MKCIKCGNELENNRCNNCGYILTDEDNSATKTNENKKEIKFFKDESLNSIMNMTKKIIDDNKVNNDNHVILEKPIDSQKNNLFESVKNGDQFSDNKMNNTSFQLDNIEEANFEINKVFQGEPLNDNLNNDSTKQIMETESSVESGINSSLKIDENNAIVEIPDSEENNNLSFNYIKEEVKEDNNTTEDSNLIISNFNNKDELDIFVGKNADNIIYKKYSVLAGLLGEMWLLYRKCYLPGIILGVLNCLFILYVLFLTETPIYLYFIVRFILYFVVSKEIYISSAKKKIKKIEKNNASISDDELTKKIQKKGGTCIIAPIIYIISFFIIVVGIFLYIYKFGSYSFNNLKIRSEGWGMNESNQLVYTFNNETCLASVYYATKDDQSISSILYQKGIIDEQQYLEQSYDLSQLEKETINDNDWYKTTITDANNLSEEMLISEKDNYVYLVNLKGLDEDDYQLCQSSFSDLKSRLKFK